MDTNKALTWQQGVMASLPIAAGYIPIAIAFGLTASAAGLSLSAAQGMSLLVFAGASQFMAVQMISSGTAWVQIIMATFVLNLRHLLMSASLAERLPNDINKLKRAIIAFGITDETFSVNSLQTNKLTVPFVITVNLIAFLAWNIGTTVGVVVGSGLPETVQQSLGIALYAMFIGLLVPAGRKWKPALIIAGIAALFNALLQWMPGFVKVGASWGIIIAIIIAAGVGTILPFDKEVN